MDKKCILLLLDGLGDRSFPTLDHRTPLQAAKTPALDRIATRGSNGLYHAGLLGQALPSENAHFAIFGYDPEDFPGRGVLEGLGAGIPASLEDVVVLAHLACVTGEEEGFRLLEGKPRLEASRAGELIEAVSRFEWGGVRISFHQTSGLFGVLHLQGHVSRWITDSDPMLEGRPITAVVPWRKEAGDPAAEKTASAMTRYLEWSHDRLSKHTVNHERSRRGLPLINLVVTQRAGRLRQPVPFSTAYGLRGLSISSGIVYKGLCRYLGMDVLSVEDTDDPAMDMDERIGLAHEALRDYDFVHVHTKKPDEAAHAKDPNCKREVIEALDRGILSRIEGLLDDPQILTVVTADHSTPSSGPLVHSGEAVPLTMTGLGVRRDEVKSFDEVSAAAGALGSVRGKELIYLVLNHLDKAKLVGIMDTPDDQPFWPGNGERFRMPGREDMAFGEDARDDGPGLEKRSKASNIGPGD